MSLYEGDEAGDIFVAEDVGVLVISLFGFDAVSDEGCSERSRRQ